MTEPKKTKKAAKPEAAVKESKAKKVVAAPEATPAETVAKPAKTEAKSKKTPKVEEKKASAAEVTPVEAVEKTEAKAEKAPKAEVKTENTPKPKTMADLLSSTKKAVIVPKKGTTVIGIITAISKKGLSLDIGAKTEGVVSDKEFDLASEYIDSLAVGQELEAIVVSEENNQGQVMLSLKRAALDARWEYFEEALKEETVMEAQGIDVNKGGLIVIVNGARGFVPSSQFSKDLVGNFGSLKGQNLKVRAIEVDREKNRLIFSERHVSEAEEIAQKEEALDTVKINEVYSGVVSGVMHFGLFVTVEVPVEGSDSVGHVEGLVHISEISWEKVSHPKDYHAVGDKIQVRVLGVDEKTGKLNLSIKQLSDDPWKEIADRYQPGTSVSGTVSRVENFGVFVNVEAGIDGLIHSSKLDPNHTMKKGEKITVHVESVDPDQRRMSLSLVDTHMTAMDYR